VSANLGRRVVITGLGAVTPLGNDARSSWENVVAGVSTAGPITAFDTTGYPVTFACEAKGFDPAQWIHHKEARRMDRFAQMIVAAALQAQADAGLDIEREAERVGVSAGTSIGGVNTLSDCCDTVAGRHADRIRPFAIPALIPNGGAASVSIELGTRGPLGAQASSCAASKMAIGDGMDAIRLGRADVMFCGGGEAPITELGVAGYSALRALSRRNDDPEHASRPFDVDRDGFVIAEGSAILVLEELEHARKRGARIYAEALGYGVSSDAHHISEPDPTGRSPARAMQTAFADAGISPDEIDYINAHGTSTPVGDANETRVIKQALGEDTARKIPISSTKGATGHPLGAAGAIETVFCTLAIDEGVLPPTINYDTPDIECDLDYIPKEAREADVRIAVSNSFGLGGHNATIVLGRFSA
jgi:3-oxoacyl-[acyl-carrier-protein] synthase II